MDWAETENNEVFKSFICFLTEMEERQEEVVISYCNKLGQGTIEKIVFMYNRRFSDFDFSIKLSEKRYVANIEYIYMDSIKQVSKDEYSITDKDGDIFVIKINR